MRRGGANLLFWLAFILIFSSMALAALFFRDFAEVVALLAYLTLALGWLVVGRQNR